jgi:hypothetical protein
LEEFFRYKKVTIFIVPGWGQQIYLYILSWAQKCMKDYYLLGCDTAVWQICTTFPEEPATIFISCNTLAEYTMPHPRRLFLSSLYHKEIFVSIFEPGCNKNGAWHHSLCVNNLTLLQNVPFCCKRSQETSPYRINEKNMQSNKMCQY